MNDSESLILTVQKYPCIWDNTDSHYHNREAKDFAWEQICKELVGDWKSHKDKANKLADAKKKWTNIRDYYRKEVVKRNASKKFKKYIYGELLHFLDPVFEKKGTEGFVRSASNDTTTEDPLEEQNIKFEDYDYLEIDPPSSPSVDNEPPVSTSSELKTPKRKTAVGSQKIIVMQNKQQPTAIESGIDKDDDTNFLLSFRGYMKQMDRAQKIEFKVGMLRLVKEITTGNEDPSLQSPYSDE